MLAIHLKEILDCVELTDGRLIGITPVIASSQYSMTGELKSTLEASGIGCPAMKNYIPSMAHVIQLALVVFMSNLAVKGRTKSLEAHECDQQLGQNECTDIGKSHRLRREGNDRMKLGSAMQPGSAKTIE